MGWGNGVPFETLKGKTITKISGMKKGSSEVYLETSDGKKYRQIHSQD